MNKPWYNTENDFEAQNHAMDFWNQHRKELKEGDFWADRIKTYRGESAKRLMLALDNLPLPASFKEAATATRAIIREKLKLKENYDHELALLYWLAAINSFCIPYSEVLKEPGYNVIESIPGKVLKGLNFSYHELGYQKLKLLNKTDIKWIINCWGEPDSHTILHELNIDIWKEYEDKLKAKRDKDNQAFLREFNQLGFHIGKVKSKSRISDRSSRFFIWAILILLIIIFIVATQINK